MPHRGLCTTSHGQFCIVPSSVRNHYSFRNKHLKPLNGTGFPKKKKKKVSQDIKWGKYYFELH